MNTIEAIMRTYTSIILRMIGEVLEQLCPADPQDAAGLPKIKRVTILYSS
jgi:hypothetical protein